MTIPSGPELEQSSTADGEPAVPRVPLAGLPLVADHQQTVVTSKIDGAGSDATDASAGDGEDVDLSEVLFSTDDSDFVSGSVRLEHFELRRRIGSGGMGSVFLGEDMVLRRQVALKILNPGSAGDPALLARFHNEARSATLLRHDNIAQVYFTGSSRGVHFLAFEYISGRTIRELIEEHETLSADVVLNYAVQATLALNHMYACGVIHRDIKPSNIIVSDDGRVKIVDLGLARRDSPDSVCDITVAGSTLGTFDYLAPEQARDPRQADIRSDIYSLGCTLYHMLTGRPPYPEGTAMQKMLDHQGKQAPDPARINKQVPEEIADIVLTMMKTDPVDRYQIPGELLSDLIEVATEMGLEGVPADGIVWQQVEAPAARQLSGVVVLLSAVLIFCITALSLHLIDSNTSYPVYTAVSSTSPPVGSSQESSTPDTESPATGSPRAPTEHPGGTEPPSPVPDFQDAFVVHSPGGPPRGCTTLSEALNSPRDGDEVELTFSGSASIKQLPRLDHQTVRLFASAGARPILEFRGVQDDANATSMFTLINSNLILEGIGLRLVPDGAATDSTWSVFDCSGSTYLELRQCSIDVAVADTAAVEVCRLREAPADIEDRQTTDVRLTNVVVRGAADMFHVGARTDGQILLDNCGFGLAGHLLNNTGSDSMDDPGILNLIMEHVTCVLGAPLIRIFEVEFPATGRMLPEIQVTSRAGVFCSAVDDGILIESRGTGLLDDLRDLLTWNGDTNIYCGYQLFWTLQSPNSSLTDPDFTLNEWKSYWPRRGTESQVRNIAVFDWPDADWQAQPEYPDETSMFNRLQPEWFQISGERFHGTQQQLPRYREREVPGVVVRRLPAFIDYSTDQR